MPKSVKFTELRHFGNRDTLLQQHIANFSYLAAVVREIKSSLSLLPFSPSFLFRFSIYF